MRRAIREFSFGKILREIDSDTVCMYMCSEVRGVRGIYRLVSQ